MASPSPAAVRRLSSTVVTPADPVPPRTHLHLTPFDLSMLTMNYNQRGVHFPLPDQAAATDIAGLFRDSLAQTLRSFFPLAGRLATSNHEDGICISIDCNNGGAYFVRAIADGTTTADVFTTNTGTPAAILKSFFLDVDVESCYTGPQTPLLLVQVTELADGIFVGCTYNHVVADGPSFCSFFSSWAETARRRSCGDDLQLTNPPVLDRSLWGMECRLPTKLPLSFSIHQQFSPPATRHAVFHFSAASLAALRDRANEEEGTSDKNITRYQALCSLIWRSVTRARRLAPETATTCFIPVNSRPRLHPPLPDTYFGCCVYERTATATAGELASLGHGGAASLIGKAVREADDTAIRRKLRAWAAAPTFYSMQGFGEGNVAMNGSPWMDLYSADFGLGRGVAMSCGFKNKTDGVVTLFTGRDGGGSVHAEVSLAPETIEALLADGEFMSQLH